MAIKNISVGDSDQLVNQVTDLSERFDKIKHISILAESHLKARMEVPSSMAFGVKDHICFALSSPEQNCGMALVTTPFMKDDLNDNRVDKLFNELRNTIPLPPRKDRLINSNDLNNIFSRGAEWVIDKYDLNPDNLKAIAENGNTNPTDDLDYLLSTIPNEVQDVALNWFGHVGDGNHFLEMQYVDEVIDTTACSKLGIMPGQIMIMYHSGSGYVGGLLGRFYAHRKKNNLQAHFQLLQKKAKFHLASSKDMESFVDRFKYYIFPKHFTFIPAESEEAKRSLVSIKSSTNFAYANRLFIYKTVRDIFQKVMGPEAEKIMVFRDQPHNVMSSENINGEDLWVHRHNSCRIAPPSLFEKETDYPVNGQPFFISGTNTTSSYIFLSDEGCKDTLYSVDHGAGKLTDKYIISGNSSVIDDKHTKIFTYRSPMPDIKKHYTDEAITAMMQSLSINKVAQPIARLKPIAALKGR